MKLRDSWYRPWGAPVLESVCIWCLRQASLCVIVDPCADRISFEEDLRVASPDVRSGYSAVPHDADTPTSQEK